MSHPLTVKLSDSGAAAMAAATAAAATREPSSSDALVPLYNAAAAAAPAPRQITGTPYYICCLEPNDGNALLESIRRCFARHRTHLMRLQTDPEDADRIADALSENAAEFQSIGQMVTTTLPSIPPLLQPYVAQSFALLQKTVEAKPHEATLAVMRKIKLLNERLDALDDGRAAEVDPYHVRDSIRLIRNEAEALSTTPVLPPGQILALVAVIERAQRGFEEIEMGLKREEAEAIFPLMTGLFELQLDPSASKDAFAKKYATFPLGLRQKLEGKVWELAGKPNEPNFGNKHALTDLPRLLKATIAIGNELIPLEEQLENYRSFVARILDALADVSVVDAKAVDASAAASGSTDPKALAAATRAAALAAALAAGRAAAKKEALENKKYLPLFLNALPEATRNTIYTRVWEAAGKPSGDPRFGENNACKDLERLHSVIDQIVDTMRDEKYAKMSEAKHAAAAAGDSKWDHDQADRKTAATAASMAVYHAGGSAAAGMSPAAAARNPFAGAIAAIQGFKTDTLPMLKEIDSEIAEINAQLLALLEGSGADGLVPRLLGQDPLNMLYGALYEAMGRPQTSDSDWGRNNLVQNIDKVLEILASPAFIAKAAPKPATAAAAASLD